MWWVSLDLMTRSLAVVVHFSCVYRKGTPAMQGLSLELWMLMQKAY